MKDDKVVVEVISGVEGPCLAINDYRVAGSKPWSGGQVVHRFEVERGDIADALNDSGEGE